MRYLRLAQVMLIGAIFCLGAVAGAEDKPAFNLNWYGALQLDGSFDQNLTSNGNFSMWVEPQAVDESDRQFNMTANATRLGIIANNTNRNNFIINGKLEFDLYAGSFGPEIQENNPMLQLRHAFFTIERDNLKLIAGQTNDLVSPLNPATLNYAALWGCGNIGYRRPQVAMAYNFIPNENTNVTMAAGFFRTIGSDLTPTFSLAAGESRDVSDDGTDAGIPSLQALVDINQRMESGNILRLGISGLYGKLKAETNLGNSENYENWAVVTHMSLTMAAGYGASGEFFVGSNLNSYLGSILNDSRIDGIKTSGGWVSAWVQPEEQFRMNAGVGIDDPDEGDFPGGRTQNRCIFANVSYAFIPEVTMGFEVSHWETRYSGNERMENVRAQTSISMNF